MKDTEKFLAFDLGATGGRGIIGYLKDDLLQVAEVHRFSNKPVSVLDNLHWDALRLYTEIKNGLTLCAKKYEKNLMSVSIDTWGVDFALLDANGTLLGNPYHYRDRRTDGIMEQVFRIIPREEIYKRTGVQFMQLNTIYQLFSMVVSKSPILRIAKSFLMMPDLFNFWLTGQKVCEFTNATTTQLFDPYKRAWSRAIFEKLNLPFHIMPEIVPPGTTLNSLLPSVIKETGIKDNVQVVTTASHDTASAIAAVPAQERDYVYISSGTWSLIGVETAQPVINKETFKYNFTNEGGVNETFCLLKNVTGLWILEECRRAWIRMGSDFSYEDLICMATHRSFGPIIDPDSPLFLKPEDMPSKIRLFCQQTNQSAPKEEGAVVRCVLESLALKYRWVLERLEEILGKRLKTIHIVGGGVRNHLLCQLTADATGRRVLAGPVEATAIGNIVVQMLAQNYITSLEKARSIIRNSFDIVLYKPQKDNGWNEAYDRFLHIIKDTQKLHIIM